jgi:hypothetical protein
MKDQALAILKQCVPWWRAFNLQKDSVVRFHGLCIDLLEPRCPLARLPEDLLGMERNLFSTLFLMAVEAAGVPTVKLPFYAMANQCLRVQVTGCDNILDDEYKSAIPFALEGDGIRFRSVLTVMTGDAVLATLIAEEVAAGRFDPLDAKRMLAAVLAVLIPSGIEEHEEESYEKKLIPTVERVLDEIHYRKTGLLFEAPIRLADKMGDSDPLRSTMIAKALSSFGSGCQIIDDLQDIAEDLYAEKYNLAISVAYYGSNALERGLVSSFLDKRGSLAEAEAVAVQLSEAKKACTEQALDYFKRAQHDLSNCVPDFGFEQAAALGILVQGAITAERNETIERGSE